jgi:hypothetical protein
MASNRVNAALANAYFQADIAAEQYEIYNAQEELKDQFKMLTDAASRHLEYEAARKEDNSLFGAIAGAVIGFAVGGPAGAAAGYKIGEATTNLFTDLTDDLEGMESIIDEIDEFDWQLQAEGSMYHGLATQKWADKWEEAADEIAYKYQEAADEFYDPWTEDLVEFGTDVISAIGISKLDAWGMENFDMYESFRFDQLEALDQASYALDNPAVFDNPYIDFRGINE